MFPFPLLWSFFMQTMVRLKDKHSRMSECREYNAFVYSPVPLRGKIDPSWNALKFQFLMTSKLGCAKPEGFWHHDVILPLCCMLRPYVIMIFMRLFSLSLPFSSSFGLLFSSTWWWCSDILMTCFTPCTILWKKYMFIYVYLCLARSDCLTCYANILYAKITSRNSVIKKEFCVILILYYR